MLAAMSFRAASSVAVTDRRQRLAIANAVLKQYSGRRERWGELPDVQGLRELAGKIKQHALDYLDYYLDQLKANVEKRGGVVHFAETAEDARRIVMGIVRDNGCRRIIKSKSMVSEEVDLTRHMEQAGLDVAETDLGEFIAQIARERPSHIVGPIIHMDRQAIAGHFFRYFAEECDDDPVLLTMRARTHLREKFRRADLGMTGGNFLIAETGQVCVVENEGNARHSTTGPRILVSMVGIEKVVPRLDDLAVMLKLLGRSSTGQPMTVYTNLFGGTRAVGEKDGPEQFHLVLVDNGRSRILAGEYREALRCIRCGACLNACPVYRTIGGQAYGHVYSGPIGAVITPLMNTLAEHADLPRASSLCGICAEVCPVKIDLPNLLLKLRRDLVAGGHTSWRDRMLYRLWAWSNMTPFRYRMAAWLQRRSLRKLADGDGFVNSAPGVAAAWTISRDLPAPAARSFRQLWARRGK